MIKGIDKVFKKPFEDDSDEEVPDLEGLDDERVLEPSDEDQVAVDLLQREIEAAELDQARAAVPIFKPLYARRERLIEEKLKPFDFWPRVFSNASQDLFDTSAYADADIIGALLRSFHVERISVDEKGQKGDPRDLKFVFEFSRDNREGNQWFDGGSEPLRLEKTFYWRKQLTKRGNGGVLEWEGLVSEPVRIPWKKGQDPTNGLLDAACDLFDAEKKLAAKTKARITFTERSALPEYEHLVQKLEKMQSEVHGAEDGTADDDEVEPVRFSYFNWFGYRGRDITAEESAAAAKVDEERWAKLSKGEAVDEDIVSSSDDEDDDEDEGDEGLEDAEIFPDGEELALDLADELWPGALSYFRDSFEEDHECDSDHFDALLEDGDDSGSDDDGSDGHGADAPDEPPKKRARRTA